MSSSGQATPKNKNRAHKHHFLHLHRHLRHITGDSKNSVPSPPSSSFLNLSLNRSQTPKNGTDIQAEQRQSVEQYIFVKLETYANKSRLWQLAHSAHIKRRLLDKVEHISRLYSLPEDFVRDCIVHIFVDIDRHVLGLRQMFDILSQSPRELKVLFHKNEQTDNQWRGLQLGRARKIFEQNLDTAQLTDNELLLKYCKHIRENLTPIPDPTSSNRIAQLREQAFNLDQAYEQAEQKAKDHLKKMLHSYRERSVPDLELIKEMVNLAMKYMKTRPSNEDFQMATSFLSKITILHKSKQAYENILRNTGDDFMLLRFGKVFGRNASQTTARSNDQFIYLLHMFMKSISHLVYMMKTSSDEMNLTTATINHMINKFVFADLKSSLIEFSHEIFSPLTNVDQWTWLLEKWSDALRTFPMLLTEAGGFARLLRTTIGIGIARLFNFTEKVVVNEQSLDQATMDEEIFNALQMGFYFGVAYAVVDCLQDEVRNLDKIPAHHIAAFNSYNKKKSDTDDDQPLTPTETVDKWLLVMEHLLSGGEFDRNELPKTPLTPLLLETFDSLVTLTQKINVTCPAFNELALLLRSQRADKKNNEDFYSDDELFLGAMLKSHFTFTCTTFLGNIKSAREESERLWVMPFLGQLTDDCRDFYDDVSSKSLTSYTHYAAFIGRRTPSQTHLVNPFYAFLYLCSDLYQSYDRDVQTGAFLGRRILRTLRTIQLSTGESSLREFLHIFCQDNFALHEYCSTTLCGYFPAVSDPEKSFFRAINLSGIEYARTNRKLETYVADHLMQIEDSLHIHSFHKTEATGTTEMMRDEEILISAMNYSVKAGGKRIRPLLMLMVCDLYQIGLTAVLPLACGIEYLHTSSLILDDLPAQDNSDLRRGRPTLHRTTINNDVPEKLREGRAQLAAVDLIAVSMSLINHELVKNGFSPERVNQVVSEISLSMHGLCIGQMMDLRAAHVGLEQGSGQLDELDRIAWLKTGKAIEVVLITPVILATSGKPDVKVADLTRIRELGRLMGILFQMRDDLLDVEGENIGKPAALDVKNNTVTYVSTLGVEGTRQRLKEYYQQTLQIVDECWPVGAGTIKDVVRHILERKN